MISKYSIGQFCILGGFVLVVLGLLGGIVFFLSETISPRANVIEGRSEIIDGDTLLVDGFRVRLFGIDAPELGQSCITANNIQFDCGAEAVRFLENVIGNAMVRCSQRYNTSTDYFVGTCLVRKTDIAKKIVQEGYARAYRQFSQTYLGEERYAKKRKLGLWAGEFTSASLFRAAHQDKSRADDYDIFVDDHLIFDQHNVSSDLYRGRLEVMYFWANILLLFISVFLFIATVVGFRYAKAQLKITQNQNWADVILRLDERLEADHMRTAILNAGLYFYAIRKELINRHQDNAEYYDKPSDELFEETLEVMNILENSEDSETKKVADNGYKAAMDSVSLCETIGHLVKKDYLSFKDAYDLFGGYLKDAYLRMEGTIRSIRQDLNDDKVYENYSWIGRKCFEEEAKEDNQGGA